MGRTPKGLQRCSRFRRGHRRRSLSGRSNDWLVCDMMRHKRLSLPCQLYQHDLLSARPRDTLRIPHALRIVSRGLWMARPSGHHLLYWLQRMEACRHPDRHVLTALRTITTPGKGGYENEWKWDYGPIKPPPIPPSQSVWEESDEEGEEMERISSRLKIASLRLAPRPKAASLDSIEEGGRRSESSTSQISVPLSSASLSDSNTFSTTTTTSPPTPASEHFAEKLAKSLSIRSSKSSRTQMKQLKKKPPKPQREERAIISTDHWIIG